MINLLSPAEVTVAGYRVTEEARVGITLTLANVPADANFVEADSDVQADGGRVEIDLDLSEAVAANAEPVTITWSFADGASFGTDAECFDSTDGTPITNPAVIAATVSADCRSVVSAGSETAQILITANAGSAADDTNLNLEILGGVGYNIGTAQPTHIVDIIAAVAAAPVVSFASAGPSTVPHGGSEVRILVNLSSPVPAGETLDVQWSWLLAFDAGAPVCPTTISDDATTLICSTTVDGNAVPPASANSFEIVFNSAGSDADDIGDSQAINLEAAVGYTLGTPNSHEVEIIAQPVVGFTAETADGVFWGRDNLTFSVSFAPPLSANPDVDLPFDFFANGFNINWVQEVDDASNVLDCTVGTSCDLTNADETQLVPIEATVQFTQAAATTPGPRAVTVSLSAIYLAAINAAIDGDHDYIFGNQSLEVDVINPTISRTPNLPIDIREGESANVVFTRFPIIGNGDNFAVGVGFANGASAADIATITVNGNACDLAATEISCTGNFGSGVGGLTVAISIDADTDPAELAEQISLTLTVQNDHDINPAAGLFAVVNILNVPNADFAAADSELAHSDGTTGGQTEVQLDLAGIRPPADYRVAWSLPLPMVIPLDLTALPSAAGMRMRCQSTAAS